MKTSGTCLTGLFLAAAVSFAGQCLGATPVAPFKPPEGILYNHQKAPLQVKNVQNVSVNQAHGQSSSKGFFQYYILFFSWGNCSIEEAAREGGLARVDYVDYEYLSILNGFFGITTIHAYGPRKEELKP